MAIWQLDFHVVKRGGSSKGSIDEILTWNIPFEVFNNVDFLEPKTSWMENVKQFGDLESDCIEISVHNGMVDSIFMRIDLSIITDEKIKKICKYLESINADILYDENIIYPSEQNLKALVAQGSGIHIR